MKIKQNLFILLFLLILAVGIFPYLSNKGQVTQNIPVSPTNIPINNLKTTPAVISSGRCHAVQIDSSDSQAILPDPSCTPGEIDPSVTQDNISITVCRSGYTQTVRPPVSYTNSLKKQQIADYGYKDTVTGDYEEDHFISLELGGSPKDPGNLWPEPHSSPNEKDKVENYLHLQVCSGKLSLLQAQEEITKNWYEIYRGMK
jgi:hypothetical protein